MTTIHLGIARRVLVKLIQQRGARFIDPDYEGTDTDAILDLLNGPQIVCTCPCRKGPRGECTGEPAAEGRAP